MTDIGATTLYSVRCDENFTHLWKCFPTDYIEFINPLVSLVTFNNLFSLLQEFLQIRVDDILTNEPHF